MPERDPLHLEILRFLRTSAEKGSGSQNAEEIAAGLHVPAGKVEGALRVLSQRGEIQTQSYRTQVPGGSLLYPVVLTPQGHESLDPREEPGIQNITITDSKFKGPVAIGKGIHQTNKRSVDVNVKVDKPAASDKKAKGRWLRRIRRFFGLP
ncbi:MAG TPA: hypothetical protein VI796_03615 [Candidatus Thermoplasmatota archaeon]|nr:hypothetical protein [Candidatus Thermoplasmatota archaeon]